MSKRLQVVVDDDELVQYEQAAKALSLSLSGWVRQSLRQAQREVSTSDVQAKLDAIRRASACSFPTGDIDEMLTDIERGYLADRP